LIGQVVELWVEKNKDLPLSKFCEETEIPRDAVDVRKLHDWAGHKGPDLQIEAKRDVADKWGNSFKEGGAIAIVEAKSTTLHTPGAFCDQIDAGREDLMNFLKDPKKSGTAKYGVLFVLDYDIWSSSEEGLSMPESVGNYKNPYIEITRRG
jgi:hypothetical protein